MKSRLARTFAAAGTTVALFLMPTAAAASPPPDSGVVARDSTETEAVASLVDPRTGLAVLFGASFDEIDGVCQLVRTGAGDAQLIDAPGSGRHVVASAEGDLRLFYDQDLTALFAAVNDETACPDVEPIGVGEARLRNIVHTAMAGGAFIVSFTVTGWVDTGSDTVQVVARRQVVETPDGSVIRRDASVQTSG